MDQINLGGWIDRRDVAQGGISCQTAQLVHAVLGQDGTRAPVQGDVLPPLWHWYAFPPAAPMSELGSDGHPRLGDFMPPLRLNRRMWSGGSVEFIRRLHVGEALRKHTRIANIEEKQSASGEMVVVSLDHEIHAQGCLAVKERQTIVYLQIPDEYAPPRKTAAPGSPDIAETVPVSTPLLFRYSAITFNAHRIHYDKPYAQQVEHYPDLVVHGPLQANLLIDLATRHRGFAPSIFTYRGVHPLFAEDGLSLCAVKTSAAEWSLCAAAGEGHQTMQANATWEI